MAEARAWRPVITHDWLETMLHTEASWLSFDPAFGHGDTPHYGL